MKGYIHSIESLGTLDGPGLRTVVFFQGCPLECKFCHNLDCALKTKKGEEYTLDELLEKVMKNKEYWGMRECRGGVTVSGGEPTYQPEFLKAFLKKLQEADVHTTVDSCLFTRQDVLDDIREYTDYWMVSMKHMDDDVHQELTGVSNKIILKNIEYLDQSIASNKNLRIRLVVIPTITDTEVHLQKFGEFVAGLKNVDFVELLAYGTHGAYKWEETFGEYPLEGIPEAKRADLEKVKEMLTPYNLNIRH